MAAIRQFVGRCAVDTWCEVLLGALPLAILLIGQTVVLFVGKIDLSMNAVVAMGSVMSACVTTRHAPHLGRSWMTASRASTGLGMGVLVRLFNGACTALLRMPAFSSLRSP